MQHQLLEDHKTPCLFVIRAKHGTVPSGSDNLVEKFMKENAKDDTWEEAFDNDDEEITDGTQMPEVVHDLDHASAKLLPKKLPAILELMTYEELWKTLGYGWKVQMR